MVVRTVLRIAEPVFRTRVHGLDRCARVARHLDLGNHLDMPRRCVAHDLDVVGSRKEPTAKGPPRSEEHTSELQSQSNLVCRLLLEKKKKQPNNITSNLHNDKFCLSTEQYEHHNPATTTLKGHKPPCAPASTQQLHHLHNFTNNEAR